MARDMMLTPEEYMAFIRLIESERESEGTSLSDRRLDESSPKPKRKQKVSKYGRAFGRMLKDVKQTSRLKDGSYRKGWSSSKEMSKAHKLTRKMMK